ncbi:hypothetical protein MAPG_07494, partial [Magnaporthiopsis poae ATCC 64411]
LLARRPSSLENVVEGETQGLVESYPSACVELLARRLSRASREFADKAVYQSSTAFSWAPNHAPDPARQPMASPYRPSSCFTLHTTPCIASQGTWVLILIPSLDQIFYLCRSSEILTRYPQTFVPSPAASRPVLSLAGSPIFPNWTHRGRLSNILVSFSPSVLYIELFGNKRSLSEPNSNPGSRSGSCRLRLGMVNSIRPGG